MNEFNKQIYQWWLDSNVETLKKLKNIGKVRIADVVLENLLSENDILISRAEAFYTLVDATDSEFYVNMLEDGKCECFFYRHGIKVKIYEDYKNIPEDIRRNIEFYENN